ncbi:MoxR family ATPase [Paenibacillus sp. JX-17]|uniref:MoxR family ATPase n=1 Tax=Paenibacillus lacisoli TaxID=3064525 RepID=A0ABT9CG59_9BACL|nr:MoxR family ATPase [Paenibacillus sp. JX-17]MDO7908235.1 MoxR family ATPase [Paenibacillus sp. JX-17]
MNAANSFDYRNAPELLEQILNRVERVIVGKRREIRLTLIAMLAGGHVLLEDVPGVGKSMLVRTMSAALGCSFGRIQFTSDLMPADITGCSVYHPKTGDFEFRRGPLWANLVLGDELNRASARTQSALLEAMEERRVTVDGTTYQLPRPFTLIATQNPLQFEGTCRLPEAQMDRFLIKIAMGYPDPEQEFDMLGRLHGEEALERIKPVILAEELAVMQRQVMTVHVDDSIKRALVEAAVLSRTHPAIALGLSPRGTLAWQRASQAAAYMQGRHYVTPDDVKDMAEPVLVHRLQFNGIHPGPSRGAELVEELISSVRMPLTGYGGRGAKA